MARKWSVAVMLAITLWSCDSPTVPAEYWAYTPTLPNGQLIHWPLGKTIHVYVDTTAGGAVLSEQVTNAAAVWRSVVFYREFEIVLESAITEADVIVHTQQAPLLWTPLDSCGVPPGSAGGVTFFCYDETGTVVEVLPLTAAGSTGRVKMDVTIDLGSVSSTYPLRALVTHEIGHVVGLGSHSNDAADVMFGAPTVWVPSAADASTLRYLLHQKVDLRL